MLIFYANSSTPFFKINVGVLSLGGGGWKSRIVNARVKKQCSEIEFQNALALASTELEINDHSSVTAFNVDKLAENVVNVGEQTFSDVESAESLYSDSSNSNDDSSNAVQENNYSNGLFSKHGESQHVLLRKRRP